MKKIQNQKGGQMVEYALLAALVAVAGIGSIRTISKAVANGPLRSAECGVAGGTAGEGYKFNADCTLTQVQED